MFGGCKVGTEEKGFGTDGVLLLEPVVLIWRTWSRSHIGTEEEKEGWDAHVDQICDQERDLGETDLVEGVE